MLLTDWPWPHFTREELKCKGSGQCEMDAGFMDLLESLRVSWGRPLVITSGYRSPEYNSTVSNTGNDGPHTTGRAVDISIHGGEALDLLCLARSLGFTGMGVRQKGAGRFLHLDNLENGPGRPRPWLWSY